MAASELSMRLQPPASGPVVVAVSAGADSTALALLLADAKVGPLHLAHVRHGFRPDAAAQEVAALRELSRRIGAPLHVLDGAPPAAWRPGAKIPEAAARATRRRLLVELARRLGARVVALAHHARDQVETQLLMVARGGGLRALAAMSEVRDGGGVTWWRPLLAQPPDALRARLRDRSIGWVEDASNGDLRLRRNALRHRLLPHIAQHGDPLLTRAPTLSHLAARALRRIAAVAGGAPFEARRSVREGAVVRSVAALARLSPALVHELVRAWAVDQLGDAAVRTLARGRDSRELVRWLQRSRRGQRRSGDLVLERAGDELLLHDGRRAPTQDGAVHRLEPGGSVRLAGSTVEIAADDAPKDVAAERDGAPLAVWLPAGSSVTVRARRPGDRIAFSPGGSMALSRLVNELAHPGERDCWPIVCVDDAPVWVPGARRIARPATFAPAPGSRCYRARFP